MKNKKTIILSLLVVVGLACVFMFLEINKDDQKISSNLTPVKKIKIAVCPTYYEIAGKLDNEKYEIIKTSSTSESAYLLTNEDVDMLLAGRILKSGEIAGDSAVLAKGYSFLANETKTVYKDELKNVIIYTDINLEKLNQELPEFSFKQVEDVYDYLEEGVVLTTWENTNYFRAQIVHVVERDGTRFAMSRRPTLCCLRDCSKEMVAMLLSYFNN